MIGSLNKMGQLFTARLASGLRINGRDQNEMAQAELQAQAADKCKSANSRNEETASAAKAEADAKSVASNFADTLLSRLEKDKEHPKSPEESLDLLKSVTNTVEEIKKQFGQAAANQVMANILTNTEKRISAENIAGAVGGALQTIYYQNKAVMSERGNEEAYTEALETEKKLQDMVKFLNAKKDDAPAPASDGKVAPGPRLASSLNDYYGQPGQEEKYQKIFDQDFAYMTEADINDKKQRLTPYFTLSVDEFGRENLTGLVDFLRNSLGSDEAAKIIENLSGADDIFEAVEKVRDLFYLDSYRIGGVKGEVEYIDGVPVVDLARHEGPGMGKMFEMGMYLGTYMIDQVNDTIANNLVLKERMMDFAVKQYGAKELVPENCGLAGWPGAHDIVDGEHSWRDRQSGNPAIEFGQRSESTAKERILATYKENLDFYNQLADWSLNSAEKEANQEMAAFYTERYEGMAAAIEDGTDYLIDGHMDIVGPSRIWQREDILKKAYDAWRQTKPGSLLAREV